MQRIRALIVNNFGLNFTEKLIQSGWKISTNMNDCEQIDVLILNNLSKQNCRAAIEELPIENFREIFEKNTVLNLMLIQKFWPQMKRQHFGRIIQFANRQSLIASEYQSANLACQHALIGLNKVLSIEGAQFGITSNIIYPDEYFQMNTFNEFNHVKTIDELIRFLCTDQARSLTDRVISWNF